MNREWIFLATLALFLGAVILIGKINAGRSSVESGDLFRKEKMCGLQPAESHGVMSFFVEREPFV